MKYTPTEAKLMAAMADMEIIDCHEHLSSEAERVKKPADVFTLFTHYTRCDLYSAGMDAELFAPPGKLPGKIGRSGMMDRPLYDSILDPDIPLAKRWATFRPYWNAIRHTSYSRASILTAKLAYGIDDINDDTYVELSKRIAAENTPGIFQRMLVERCHIRASFTNNVEPKEAAYPLVAVPRVSPVVHYRKPEEIEAARLKYHVMISSLEDLVGIIRKQLQQWVDEGAIGIKYVCWRNTPPDEASANESLQRLLTGNTLWPSGFFEPLENYLAHKAFEIAGQLNLTVAMHAGVWGDFRDLDPKYLLSVAPMHGRTRFDLFHLGMPFIRDAVMIGKNHPNVSLNLCWSHIVSQVQTQWAIDEIIDQVPLNKILGFGGDYNDPVEKVVGHLHMAKEDFAVTFGRRIDRGMMSFDEAMAIIRLWLWDNPKAWYPLLKV